ncbi:hypothetical protein B0H13DRAFT_1472249, partial [Mycena leptocephala]
PTTPHIYNTGFGSAAYPSIAPSYGPDLRRTGLKHCSNCGATIMPLWRRDPETHHTLRNARGPDLQHRSKQRPQALICAENDQENEASDGASTGPECSHCHTRQTSVWRRNKDGEQVCNACGVYQRLRGKERPLPSRTRKIKLR